MYFSLIILGNDISLLSPFDLFSGLLSLAKETDWANKPLLHGLITKHAIKAYLKAPKRYFIV